MEHKPKMARSKKKSNLSRRNKGQRRTPKVDPSAFWGDPEKLPGADPKITITSNPAAVVKSLGRAPLSGQQNASEYYFGAIYERAVGLGAALAAAGNLIETDELPSDR